MRLQDTLRIFSAAVVLTLAVSAHAAQVEFDFRGRGGDGLLPLNGVGSGVPMMPSDSSATGGETGAGFLYDTDTNVLNFSYEFMGLSGGLADAASGMHLHLASPGVMPFEETGGIAFNLNSGADANVTLTTPLVAIGSTSGMVAGTAVFSEAQEAALFAGRYYLNIHSDGFGAGELRGNLVAVPEPAAAFMLAAALAPAVLPLRRRRT